MWIAQFCNRGLRRSPLQPRSGRCPGVGSHGSTQRSAIPVEPNQLPAHFHDRPPNPRLRHQAPHPQRQRVRASVFATEGGGGLGEAQRQARRSGCGPPHGPEQQPCLDEDRRLTSGIARGQNLRRYRRTPTRESRSRGLRPGLSSHQHYGPPAVHHKTAAPRVTATAGLSTPQLRRSSSTDRDARPARERQHSCGGTVRFPLVADAAATPRLPLRAEGSSAKRPLRCPLSRR